MTSFEAFWDALSVDLELRVPYLTCLMEQHRAWKEVRGPPDDEDWEWYPRKMANIETIDRAWSFLQEWEEDAVPPFAEEEGVMRKLAELGGLVREKKGLQSEEGR